MTAAGLSLTAELLLLAIDPTKGGFFPRRRRRFRKTLALAKLADRGGGRRRPWVAWQARRDGLEELERHRILEPRRPFRRPRLADRGVAMRRFDRLRRCIRDDQFPEPRDRELLVLIAWSGVLAERSSKAERRLAARRLQRLARASDQTAGVPHVGPIAAVAGVDLVSASFGALGNFGGGGGGGGGLGGGDGGGGCGDGGGC